MIYNQDQVTQLIDSLTELISNENGRYTNVEIQLFTQAVSYLNELKNEESSSKDESDGKKQSDILIKAVWSFVRAYVMNELFDDD